MRAGQTDNVSPSRRRRRWSATAATALIALVTFVPAAGVAASTGSIPPDVEQFAQADDGLVLELEEYFGANQRGDGLDFSDGIELGEIDRIFLWSVDYHAGKATETPVQYVNRWKVPVLIGEEPIGIAMIGIDPATVEPEMIDFIRSPGTALALDDIDASATLVHEPETGAWFSLIDGAITPLVRGDSGVSSELTLAKYQSMLSSRVVNIVDPTPQPDQGSVQSVVLIATTAGVLLLALLIPTIMGQVRGRRERLAAKADGDDKLDDEGEVEGGVEDKGETHDKATPEASDSTSVHLDADLASTESDSATAAVTPTVTNKAAPSAKKAPASRKTPASKKVEAKAETPAKKPTTTKPDTTLPAVTKPATTKQAAKKSAVKKPASGTTAAKKSESAGAATSAAATSSPAAKAAAAKKPTAKKPVAKQPASGSTTVNKTAANTNATSKPAARKPVAKKPAAPKPTGATEPSAD
ncbi:hypothetical protein [Salinibacterium sp. PAMC 21357]|uniref:hypothetical protein n=1 Tax=Salinibacterium sp. PAMC 21357 TaxID=1112215 RepID=UPI000688D41D|nr:hypothetical protein [Salinibacterium sp. PAMC 21357]